MPRDLAPCTQVTAYLQVERRVRRRSQTLRVLGFASDVATGLILKGLAHRLLGPGFEPHWGGAIELTCWIAPVPACLVGAPRLHDRWIRVRGPALLAQVAAAAGIDASTFREALRAT